MSNNPVDRNSVRYQPVATEDPHEEHKSRRAQAIADGAWGVALVDSLAFQNFIGVVIIANGVIIGLETDIPNAANWPAIEYGFLVFFMGELVFKLCVEGCTSFCNRGHPDFVWNMFDVFIVVIGSFDAIVAFCETIFQGTGGYATVFRMFRLFRILRLLRLLKFLKRLYLLAMGLVEACKAIFWVTILMIFVLYVCAIVLVRTIGRTDPSDPHYDFLILRFSCISESMETLFVLMSSPNFYIYQDEIGMLDQHPAFCIFLIAFITFGSFGMLAMLTGVINESMFENNELRKDEMRLQHEEMRQMFGEQCSDLFEDVKRDAEGEAPIEDVKRVAPQVLELVKQSGARIAHGDILKFIDNIDVDDSGTINLREFVEGMEKLAEGINPLSILAVEKSVGHCTRTLGELAKKVMDVLVRMESTESATIKVLHQLEAEESNMDKTQKMMSQHLATMDDSMQKMVSQLRDHENRVQDVLSVQVSEIGKSVQTVVSQMGTADSNLQLAVGQQTSQMQKVLDKFNGNEDRVEAAVVRQMRDLRKSIEGSQHEKDSGSDSLRDLLSQQMNAMQKNLQKDSVSEVKRVLSQDVGEVGQLVRKLADQMDATEQRLQLAVSQQIGEIRRSVQQLSVQKKDVSEVAQPVVSQQIQELQLSLHGFMEQKAGAAVAQQLESTGKSVQKVLDQWRVIGNEASLHALVNRHVEEIHGTLQRFLDQKDTTEGRLHLAVSSQIQDIATAVQKLLHDKDGREGTPLEGIVSRQVQDLRISIQAQIDSTQEKLLSGVAELGGVVLGGVADLLAKNKFAIQYECARLLREATQSQERSLRTLPGSWGSDAMGSPTPPSAHRSIASTSPEYRSR